MRPAEENSKDWVWSGLTGLVILYTYLNQFQPFLYRGGILLTALASALVIMGASSPTTSLSKLLESRILRWIRTRSYSDYLWHWPVFMLSRSGIDIHLPALLVRLAQLVITFGLAELGFRWIKSPIRYKGFRSGLRSWQATFKWSHSLHIEVERIIFINVHRPIGWEYYVNKQFAESVARSPQAELIDGMQLHTPSKSGSSKTKLI